MISKYNEYKRKKTVIKPPFMLNKVYSPSPTKVRDLARFGLIIFIIIHQTHHEKSDWLRAFNQFTIACELDMISIYHVKFNVCLVAKPLGVFSS